MYFKLTTLVIIIICTVITFIIIEKMIPRRHEVLYTNIVVCKIKVAFLNKDLVFYMIRETITELY